MKKYILILITFIVANYIQAQNSCIIQRSEAYYYEVLSGVNNDVISIDGNTTSAQIPTDLNISIYLVSNCLQTPLISYSKIGKVKMKLEFLRVKFNKDKAGTDEHGNLKIIKAREGSFLWKANWAVSNETAYAAQNKIIIKGTMGRKKFTAFIPSIKKLQPLPLY